jgi:Questin oxidase-like
MPTPCYDVYDDALDELASYDIALKNGNSNHAPMVAETLCALGHPEAVGPWLSLYRPRLQLRAIAGERIAGEAWREALGRRDRFADWAVFFAGELETDPWQSALDRWVGRLAPGFCAAATHGVIRVGHAVRGLAQGETPSRRRELGDALASWAATWQTLPEGNAAPGAAMRPEQAIRDVPLLPAARRRPGNIVTALSALADFPEFVPVAGWIDLKGPVAPQIVELCELFARIYLANARDIPTTIAFIHGVTSLAALGHIAREVGETTARLTLRYAWQSGCALYACYGAAPPALGAPVGGDSGGLAERAIANGDEHVIKFTEACLSRNQLAASPVYAAAAAHVADMIRPRRG